MRYVSGYWDLSLGDEERLGSEGAHRRKENIVFSQDLLL